MSTGGENFYMSPILNFFLVSERLIREGKAWRWGHLLDHHIYKLNQMRLDCEEGLFRMIYMYIVEIGDITCTCPCVDMNFIFEYITRYLASEHSERVRYRVEDFKILNFISTSGHIIFCLLYKHQWKRRDLLCNHNDGDLFTCEDNMSVSCVKIWSFRTKAHLVFHWCLYIIKNYIICSIHSFTCFLKQLNSKMP